MDRKRSDDYPYTWRYIALQGSVIFDHSYNDDSMLEVYQVQLSSTAPISAIPVRTVVVGGQQLAVQAERHRVYPWVPARPVPGPPQHQIAGHTGTGLSRWRGGLWLSLGATVVA